MTFMVTFKVDANPVGKQRARYVKRGNFVQTYTPEKTRTYETLIKDAAIISDIGGAAISSDIKDAAIDSETEIAANDQV